MNIFYLDKDPKTCAEYHCDKHVVKMIIETAQLLCTAHRVLDGKETIVLSANNRKMKKFIFDDSEKNNLFYKSCFINHPCGVWTRESKENYDWLFCLFYYLCKEYEFRYGKIHKTFRLLVNELQCAPSNISRDKRFTEPPQCMPDVYKQTNTVYAYWNYYCFEKKRFAVWTKRDVPKHYSLGRFILSSTMKRNYELLKQGELS